MEPKLITSHQPCIFRSDKGIAHASSLIVGCVCSAISKRVVEVENIITSQAPGTAMEFSLTIVKRLFGEEKAQEVAGPMVV